MQAAALTGPGGGRAGWHPVAVFALLGLAAEAPPALELDTVLQARALAGDDVASWVDGGTGKQQFDGDDLHGRGLLQLRAEPVDGIRVTAVAQVDPARHRTVDVSELFVGGEATLNPAWQARWRSGAFFPALSEENDGVGWTAPRGLSTSAINAWIGEELRVIGGEIGIRHAADDSPHRWQLVAGAFVGNDPAGALLAWRGWTVGDYVSGLGDRLALPPLPVIAADGALAHQVPWVEPFHEYDGRVGGYAGLRYSHEPGPRWSLWHYDNRADQNVFERGQYAWHTRFDQIGLNWPIGEEWELLGQYLRGDTRMGPRESLAVDASFDAGYLLLSWQFIEHRLSLRGERFSVDDHDSLPGDDNSERGRAWALAYVHARPDRRWRISVEWLQVDSTRPARATFGEPARRIEQSLSIAWHWHWQSR